MDEELRDSLKYRVWDNSCKMFCFDDVVLRQDGTLAEADTENVGCLMGIEFEQNRYTIERCTGMKDRKGKLIYENDRFKNGGLFWWVTWFRYGWYATAVNEHGSQGWARLEDFDSITILGTIHDDKEAKDD